MPHGLMCVVFCPDHALGAPGAFLGPDGGMLLAFCGYPEIIGVMDDHLNIETHCVFGIPHFKKPPHK